MQIKTNSYFSGAGIFDIGLRRSGLDIQQSFEIDPKACKTQRLNFNHEVLQCDISEKLVRNEKGCDVMIATYPCNKYSAIADIHGTRTGDDLFLHFFRHIAIKLPEIYVVENVPGMRKFPVVMEAMTMLPQYDIQIFCPVDTKMWLPQKRERIIIIGSKKRFGFRPPEAKSKPTTLKDILDKDPQVTNPKAVSQRLNGAFRDAPIISDPERGDLAPCAVAHYTKDRSTRLLKDDRFPMGVRPYTPREYARLQGVPDDFKFACTDNQIYNQVGNGVAVPVGEWVGSEIQRYFAA